MSVINSQPLIGASGNQGGAYNLTRSLRFRSSASAFLNRTPSSTGNRRTWTWSAWVKRGSLGVYQPLFTSSETLGSNNNANEISITSSNTLNVFGFASITGTIMDVNTTQVFRDPSAWYHIVVAIDTPQATASNRVKVYVNGTQVTAFGTTTYPSQNYDLWTNVNNMGNYLGRWGGSGSGYLDGYMAEVNHIDGQALTPSDFGETDTATGVWKPKKYTGTYGTNGFYLKFDNLTSTSTLGNDSSGNNNTWTVNNISLTSGATYDSMKDVPTLTDADTANYAVLNPLDKNSSVSTVNGNLQVTNSNSSWLSVRGTIGMSSGKWYIEYSLVSGLYAAFGIANSSASLADYVGVSGVWGYVNDGAKVVNGTNTGGYGSSFTTNDIIGMAFDADAGSLTFYKNNVSQGTLVTGLSAGTYFPWITVYNSNAVINFGQRPFAYTPPSGFKALNTFNLPTPTIGATASTQANDYFDATIWTGNGSNPRTITNAGGFYPDLVWGKIRSQPYNHQFYDSIRGTGKSITSNTTGQTITNETDGYITAFNSNGFTVGAGATSNNYWNQNTQTYVAWQWNAGSGSSSSNTQGSITSTVSANQSAGFSIVQYVGTGANATVGHGLSAAPSMIIVKSLTRTDNWIVYHSGMTSAAYYMYFNATNAQAIGSTVWNSTAPTSTVFSLGSDTTANSNGATQIAYCFAEVAGYSRFGSYTGNGSTDGPFVFCGFRPKFVMTKASSSVTNGHWIIKDTARDSRNLTVASLYPNLSNAEDTVDTAAIDILSNGFKIRGAFNGINNSGSSYIYIAFAENPFKYSLAR